MDERNINKPLVLSGYNSLNNNIYSSSDLMVFSHDLNSNTSGCRRIPVDQKSSINDSYVSTDDTLSTTGDDSERWQLDYICNRDERSNMHTSILSMCIPPQSTMLSYDDLSRNIDANLAEIDMETFRSEDINSILALPPIYSASDEYQSEKQGQQTASLSASLLDNLMIDQSGHREVQTSSSGADSAGEVTSTSEPLFSPVKEPAPLPLSSVSVDSLDCESFDDQQELIITCQANKENYTIAFEGSYTHVSEDSDYHDADPSGSENNSATWSHTLNNGPSTTSSSSMVQSDYVYTTWQKLRNRNDAKQNGNEERSSGYRSNPTTKTRSLPNLSQKVSMVGSASKLNGEQLLCSSGSDQLVRLFDIQGNPMGHSKSSDASSQHSFSLVRLFVHNKTSVTPEMDESAEDGHFYVNTVQPSPYAKTFHDSDDFQEDSESFEDSLVDDQRPKNSKLPATSPIVEEDADNDTDRTLDDLPDEDEAKRFVTNGANHHVGSRRCRDNGVFHHDICNQSQGTQTRVYHQQQRGATDNRYPRCDSWNSCNSISDKTGRFCSRVSIATTRTIATQIPVPLVDRCVQTSPAPDAENKTSVIADQPTVYEIPCGLYVSSANSNSDGSSAASSTGDSPQDRKSIYVCYPNYSLPDLSFLTSCGVQSLDRFMLRPSKHAMPAVPRRSHSSEGRLSERPKSVDDVDSVRASSNAKKIHDLDSLKFLLPEAYRSVLCGDRGIQQWSSADSSQGSDCQRCRMKLSGSSDNDVPPMLPNRNPSDVFYNHRTKSSAVDDADKPPPLPPKRSISLPSSSLPKGILRKNNGRPELKTNRYSMNDLSTQKSGSAKRCSLQEPLDVVWENCLDMTAESKNQLLRAMQFVEELSEMPEFFDDRSQNEFDCGRELRDSRDDVAACPCQNQARGQVVGDNQSDSSDGRSNHLERRRSSPNTSFQPQVPQSYRTKKSVSFSENILNAGLNVNGIGLRNQRYGSVFPDEFIISPTRDHPCMVDEGLSTNRANDDTVVVDLKKKRVMVDEVKSATTKLITYCNQLLNYKNELSSDVVKMIVNDFSPKLYALLNDGLLPTVNNIFGQVQNSLWRVIEASSPPGATTKSLHELVLHVNGNEDLNCSKKKFAAFVIGLMNIRSLDSWLKYLRLMDGTLGEHYDSHSFLFLSANITKIMFDELLNIVHPLAALPFRLDMNAAVTHAVRETPPKSSERQNKSDETLSSLLSQARELRKAISETSKTTRPLSQLLQSKDRAVELPRRPKSLMECVKDSDAKCLADVDVTKGTEYKQVSPTRTDEELLVTEWLRCQGKKSEVKVVQGQGLKSELEANSCRRNPVPKESVTVDKNKSDEVKFSELKQKWELLAHENDDLKTTPANKKSFKKASYRPPSPSNPTSPTKLKTSMTSSRTARKSLIPLPRSSSQSKGPSSLPVPTKRTTSVPRQLSCPPKTSLQKLTM